MPLGDGTTLLKVLIDPGTPASVKVRAAEAIFQHAAKAIEIEDIEGRVAALERAAEAGPNRNADHRFHAPGSGRRVNSRVDSAVPVEPWVSGKREPVSSFEEFRRASREPWQMKFRFVLLGPEDDPEGQPNALADTAAEISRQSEAPQYQHRGAGTIRRERLPSGRWKVTTLANFKARIVRDLILDGDTVESRHWGVEAELGGRHLSFTVPAAEFARMNWVWEKLGPEAIVYPGQQQHARAAIQCLSGAIPQERIFTHLGWRQDEARWVYLHAGGAIASEGTVSGLQVQLPAALQGYQLRLASDVGAQQRAVRASLGLLKVAPERISLPLLAAVYRAALGKVDFSLFVVGATGRFKTALAALCQQHFGAAMEAHNLPGNFSSTANGLEGLAFYAKDALLVVDDFAPRRVGGDGALQSLAERLFRAAGNRQGRSRLGADGRPQRQQPPRGLLLATGEAVPQGASIRARLVIVEVGAGAVDRAMLSESQRVGQEGRLVEAMAGFVAWMAGRYEELQGRLRQRVLEIRNQVQSHAAHARLPGALAELQAAWEMFLQYGVEVGAVGRREQEELAGRAARVLGELGQLQGRYQEERDVARRFLVLLREALVGGQGHVANRRGGVPEKAERWGWQRRSRGWRPQGRRIGWVEGNDLFLDSTASYEVAEEVAGREGLGVSEQTLRHRMRAAGLLVSTDASRHMVPVRRMVEGRSRAVLHLKARDLVAGGRS